ncbi:50S ribosomal protein L6 [Shewanella schlegeliana]|uniref:Large ribosomal subunit protein uL6 n=1 Tax=Shewanella schlegeliana TaxID=190308 RepID=A0ABS1T5W8_9GAMM|nr:50S ribosomal protein L6 [Shewanella schlegeliana]MBL4915529.1 50S ribosomal protein L6 [Shewanella schlegeliana]MCL1111920.1 50S ribosomal protein L6 [Shewanella schlegeliana]GIU37161.1 50S ribosomal protein L6 [Shewanella schlegeliana]
MSRVAKAPVAIPAGVEVTLNEQTITVKGTKGSLTRVINQAVSLVVEGAEIKFGPVEGVTNAWAQAGTARALVNNMVIGVSEGFEKKLQLIGVGYRAKIAGNGVDLTLGFSHPLVHELPAGVTAECPSQTEIVLKGTDKQLIGQVAAEIRGYRPPEPYKGKGVRYADEQVRRKEAKKK